MFTLPSKHYVSKYFLFYISQLFVHKTFRACEQIKKNEYISSQSSKNTVGQNFTHLHFVLLQTFGWMMMQQKQISSCVLQRHILWHFSSVSVDPDAPYCLASSASLLQQAQNSDENIGEKVGGNMNLWHFDFGNTVEHFSHI